MSVKIKRMYQLVDDYLDFLYQSQDMQQTKYVECYPKKTFLEGLEYNVFIIEGRSFYEIELSHIPAEHNCFILDIGLSMAGIIYNYNPRKRRLFIYNATQNNIYIWKDDIIGECYDR